MTATDSTTWALFFSNKLETSETRRLGMLRRYAEDGPGAGITVHADAAFLTLQKYSSIMIVEAERAALDSALAAARDYFDVEVHAVRTLVTAPESGPHGHVVIAYRRDEGVEPEGEESPPPGGAHPGTVRVSAEIAGDGRYRGLCMVDAPATPIARLLGAARFPGARVVALRVRSVAEHFRAEFRGASQEKHPAASVAAPSPSRAAQADTYTVVNQGKTAVFIADAHGDELDYAGLFAKRARVESGTRRQLVGTGYVWSSEAALQLPYHHEWDDGVGNSISHHAYNCKVTSAFPPPVMSLAGAAGSTLGFDVAKPHQLNVISKLTTWLDELLNTDKHDDGWPEDSYPPDKEAAYKYIVSQIPGVAVPKDGTIKPGLLEGIHRPAGASYSQTAFDEVYRHLKNETTYFEYSFDWFSPKGVFGVLNQVVYDVQEEAFTDVRTQLGGGDRSIEMALESILSLTFGFMSAVPKIGSPVAGAIGAIIDALSPDSRSARFRAAISAMAQELTHYIQTSMDALGEQHRRVNSNWGKLSTFAIAAIDGKKGPVGLTPQRFGIDGSGRVSQGGTVTPPPGVVEAASRAWTVSIYKSMIRAVGDQRGITMIPSAKPVRTKKWDSEDWYYRSFLFSLPATWYDASDKVSSNKYLECDCSSNLPRPACNELFGPRLEVNPIEFFLGLNGWPGQHYSLSGLTDYSQKKTDCPLISIASEMATMPPGSTSSPGG